MIALFLIFPLISALFSTVASAIYIPINGHKGSLFSTPLVLIRPVICCLLDNSHFDLWEVISHCGFDLHFSNNWSCWASFYLPVGHLFVFFGKMSVQSFAYFLIGPCFLKCWVVWVLCIFWVVYFGFYQNIWIWPLVRFMICKYLSPFSRCPFHFVDDFLHGRSF